VSIEKTWNLNKFVLNLSTNIGSVQYHNWSVACMDVFGYKRLTDTRKFTLIVMVVGNFSGDTTDLTTVNLSRIENLTFEDTSYGKIKFSDTINLSGVPDISKYVKISGNRIEINSSAIPALNTNATLYMYNLTFGDPRILLDGEVCPSTICNEVSYVNGSFIFNVTKFSVYSTEETPTPPTPPSGGGSSGGGGSGGGGGGGGSGAFYVCNMDWDCTEWTSCENGWETRECDFVKVPQHTSNESCAIIEDIPKMANKCEVEEIKGTSGQDKDATEKDKGTNNAVSSNLITGAVVGDVGNSNLLVGIVILSVIVAGGFFIYRNFKLYS